MTQYTCILCRSHHAEIAFCIHRAAISRAIIMRSYYRYTQLVAYLRIGMRGRSTIIGYCLIPYFLLLIIGNISFAQVFTGLESSIINLNCTYQGYSVCCCALDERDGGTPYAPSDNFRMSTIESLSHHGNAKVHTCEVSKIYQSSPYELRQLAKATELVRLKDDKSRYDAWVNYIASEVEIDASRRWLRRVKYHMNHADHSIEHEDDYEYLSRFIYTKTCMGATSTWHEWIEPITVHMRHPFAFHLEKHEFGYQTHHVKNYNGDVNAGLISVDHVLLQNGYSLLNQSYPRHHHHRARNYLFDAGTSRFDSSLWYFTCAYAQQEIYFDRIFGWEKSIQEPVEFWSKVPTKWKSLYSFYNVPVVADPDGTDSPYRIMKDLQISAHDFVAFKLDIDHPETEIPMALYLANQSHHVANIVDEFFFELHYRDLYMMMCCFGIDLAHEVDGFQLDVANAMNLFLTYRKQGIRSHVWP
jgi:hypothetical protein